MGSSRSSCSVPEVILAKDDHTGKSCQTWKAGETNPARCQQVGQQGRDELPMSTRCFGRFGGTKSTCLPACFGVAPEKPVRKLAPLPSGGVVNVAELAISSDAALSCGLPTQEKGRPLTNLSMRRPFQCPKTLSIHHTEIQALQLQGTHA